MKKILQVIAISGSLLLAGSYNSSATIHNVSAADFQFTPAIFTVNVGDTIHWFWVNGIHTTTAQVIPTTAQWWDQPLSSASSTFDYIVTVPGIYNYTCTPHSGTMDGQFTALNATSIQENAAPSLSLIKNYVNGNQLHFDYSMPSTATISIELFDVLGHQVYVEKIINQSAGIHSHRIGVAGLPKGIYILSLFAQNSRLTQRLIIE